MRYDLCKNLRFCTGKVFLVFKKALTPAKTDVLQGPRIQAYDLCFYSQKPTVFG